MTEPSAVAWDHDCMQMDGGEVGRRDVRGHLRQFCVEPCFNFAHPHIFNMLPFSHWTWVRHPLAVGHCAVDVSIHQRWG